MTKTIVLLFLSIGTLYGQNDLPCESVIAYFDSLSANTVGLMMYDKAPALIGRYKQLFIELDDSIPGGRIFVWFVIDKQGKPQCTRIMRSDNEKLNEEALTKVKELRFTPAEQLGKPMVSPLVLPVTFGERKEEGQIIIKGASIYKYFPKRGFTTAGLTTELRTLMERQVKLFPLTADDVSVIEKIMRNSRVKKHFQTKTGGGVFGVMQKKSETIDVVIFTNVIFDVTNYVNYWVEDEKDRTVLSELIVRIKKENIGN